MNVVIDGTQVEVAESEPPSPLTVQLTRLQFMERFTDSELVAIYDAAKTSTAVLVWLEKVRAAEFINPTDQRTADGVRALEAVGLIEEGRADAILS